VSLARPRSEELSALPTDERLERAGEDVGLSELYFNYGRYLLLSSSRGKLPANLQGIWCNEYFAPWSADYHININIQMIYWLAEVSDLPELVEPFFDLIRTIAASGEKTARVLYGCPGWVAHFTTNPWGYTSLGVMPLFGACVTAGAWCLRHVKDRYLFSGDVGILREFYPILRGAAEFFLSFLVRDPRSGYLVTVPASSPENYFLDPETKKPVNLSAAPTSDVGVLREILPFVADTADLLGVDADFAAELRRACAQLPPYRIGKYGQLMEWSEDFDEEDPGHRHIAHLYALHPSDQITRETPALFEAAKKTLERRLAHGSGHTGWSRAWIVNFYARLFDGNAAYGHLTALYRTCTFINLFDYHPVDWPKEDRLFQLDGNLGGAAGIAEMLLQSHAGVIELLPALPDAWPEGEFTDWKARGGCTVSARWKDGRIVSCRIDGKEGAPYTVRWGGETHTFTGSFRYGV
jgi:alpha-L-fucosidase 2